MLIFLDFDGVLHPFFPLADNTDAKNQLFSSVPDFERAIRESPVPVEIVISSTWRNRENLFQLRSHFSPFVGEKIIGFTPNVSKDNGPGSRQVEVEAWLKENNREGEPWIGVDDFPQLYAPGAAVVACLDKFDGHERALLLEALADPVAYAQRYPISQSAEEKRIIAVGKLGNR